MRSRPQKDNCNDTQLASVYIFYKPDEDDDDDDDAIGSKHVAIVK